MDKHEALLIQILRNQQHDLNIAYQLMHRERNKDLYSDAERALVKLRIAQTEALLDWYDPPSSRIKPT